MSLEGYSGSIYSVVFGPNRHLASASTDEVVRVWDSATGSLL